jgi:hypothetical protein
MNWRPLIAPSSTLRLEVAGSFETLVITYHTPQSRNREVQSRTGNEHSGSIKGRKFVA